MPEEAMIVRFSGDVSSATAGIKEVSLKLKEQQAVLTQLRYEYSKLSNEQRRTAFGKEMAADIRIASGEIQKLKASATSSFGAVGQGATKAFSAVRQFAYVLPGIGIAGIVGGLADMVIGLFESASAFDKASLSAEIFKDSLDDIKTASDNLKSFLDLQNKINDLKFRISGGTGAAADINNLKGQLSSTNTIIKDATTNLNKFNQTEKNLINDIKGISSILGQLNIKNPLIELALSGKDLTKITAQEAGKLPKVLQPLVNAYIENRKAIIDEDKKLTEARGNETVLRLQIQKTEIDEQRRLSKTGVQKKTKESLRSELGSIQIELEPVLAVKPDNISKIKQSVLRIQNEINKPSDFSKVGLDKPSILPANLDSIKKHLEDLQVTAQQVGNTLAGAFGKAFDAVAQGENVFKALGEAVKELVLDLIKAAVQSLIIGAVFKAFGLPVPGGAIFGGLFGHATGGAVAANRPIKVGETGTELFVPSTAGRIIPNNQLNSLQGSAQPVIMFNGRLAVSGSELKLLLNRTDRYQNSNV